ncbi:vitamin K-dependent protein C [Rhinoraja longicauda]
MVKVCCCFTFLMVTFMEASSHSVFLPEREATEVLRIRKRANGLLEEFKAGDLERECNEEICEFEEVREIFRATNTSLIFWNQYVDGDQCKETPCANNATCQDLIGSYRCHCPNEFDGPRCQYELVATNCTDHYGYCAHNCQEIPDINRRECSCVKDYILSDNGYSCTPQEEYSCGLIKGEKIDPRITGGSVVKKGSSPWQVLLMDASGRFICGGVLIHRFWILTAAHCVNQGKRFKVILGEHNRTVIENTEDIIVIHNVRIHPNFSRRTMDNDIALLQLSQAAIFTNYTLPICLPIQMMAEEKLLIPNTQVTVTGWGAMDENDDRIRPSTLLYIDVKLVSHNKCKDKLGHNLTHNMICAGDPSFKKDACKGDSGGPMVAPANGTKFLVGLVSWGEGCGRYQRFGVYTKVSNYLEWIESIIEN